MTLVNKPKQSDWRLHLKLTAESSDRPIMLALMTLIFLPYDALINISAIAQSGLRMLFTKRGLLLWQLPGYARRNQSRTLLDYFREMWIAPLLAIGLIPTVLLPSASDPLMVLVFCMPVLALWLMSPAIAWWLSQPLLKTAKALTLNQQKFLRISARKTWRYFADFVTADDNWLPPDNFQQYPSALIASRTSPTNMGMSLLADLAACDFGYITTRQSIERITRTLTTMEKLDRYRGHFYNWYDTRTLQVLPPYYISSVDSGNLAGGLLTLKAGLAEFKSQPIFSAHIFKGLQDTFWALTDSLAAQTEKVLAREIKDLDAILQSLSSRQTPWSTANITSAFDEIREHSNAITKRLSPDKEAAHEYWLQAFNEQLSRLDDEYLHLLAERPLDDPIPTLLDLANEQNPQALHQLNLIDDLIQRCQTLAVMDFGFLYDAKAELLTIGFDVTERRRDLACYDLLASEARLASFLLIAQGQVPQKHWFALGRLLTSHGGDISLISWSGSMFEYLMPQLIMPSYPETLLDHTCKAAVSRQIQYGRQRSVPWGISESCYNTTDLNQIYQYRAFGVPGLGFKRGLGEDLVIAPYATALALMVMPQEACLNLQVLAEQGFAGDFGFYEAIDYTPLRVPRNKPHAIVRSFMAHHQGMSLLAFAHVLLDQPMQRRFLSDPQVRATELLLQERVPKQSATLHPHAAEVSATAKPAVADNRSMIRVFRDIQTAVPEVHLLSNGRYHVMATSSGGSYSRWQDLAINRWREDVTADNWGSFIYLRDIDNGQYWSSAFQPTLRKADHYEAIFVQARAEYRRLDSGIEAHTEISVSPEDDVEIRRLTLTNQSPQQRHIEVTSYTEVVLAPLTNDLAHRAFSNLFVQTEILADRQAIICTRRPRTAGEKVPWMFHLMAAPGAVSDPPSFETDRSKFIGRGRSPVNPVVMATDESPDSLTQSLSNTDGSVLDPIVAIRRMFTLSTDASAVVQIISGIAESREAALALVDKYCDRHFVERAFEMAWFQSQEVLRHLNISEADAQIYGRLANSVIFSNGLRRASPAIIARNQLGQSRLWRFAISGDLPIVLLHIGDINRIELVKQALHAHAYWRTKGVAADLVIINEDFSSYRAELHDHIMALINAGPEAQVLDKPGGVFLRRSDELSEDERVLLKTVARLVFSDTHDTLIEQVDRRISGTRPSDQLSITAKPASKTTKALLPRTNIFDNGLGGFTPDGHEYVIQLEPGQTTPAPWVNVIASPFIGTVVSDSGSAYTWVNNAHEFRLTPWLNDPVSDASGEALYIRDEATGEFWSPTPLPARGHSGYVCRHGFGYSVFEHIEADIASELTTYVAMDAAVKFVVVKLTNHAKRTRKLSLTGYWEWVLGEWRHSNLMHIVTEAEPLSGAIFARNAYSREYSDKLVFVHISEQTRSMTGNRTEFIGRNGSLANPAAMLRKQLSGHTGAGLDPCAAIQSKIELAAGQSHEIVFIMGATTSVQEANLLIDQYGGRVGAKQALESVWEFWNHTLGTINVETPDTALNVMANGWLLYQTLSCRLWGRSGYYQSGGAFGFRDQLQDTMALVHATPWLAREQILLCAGRQFIKGDVQHWWHPPHGQGVRTHFSDDYLWLPYATCRYVMTTGDTGILDEQIHFLEGRELNADEEAYYDQPQRSAEIASVYEHCVRALKHGLRFGAHQLPLMGCGDWNDGMNLVGQHGKGESVWLAWFLYDNLQQFSQLAITYHDADFADKCRQQAELLRENIEKHAWDGEWYQRAWFDDGTPLGSASNDECQIDSISQSWSVLSNGGQQNRRHQAMNAVDKHLVRREVQLIQLLDPPFDKSALEPGYIKGYVPGVRENGGQYTHAAIWTTMAFARMGDKKRAWEFYQMLNPVNHGDSADSITRYKVEPYVMCADIYGAAPHTGRGGWTWYTGAAGWMYRLTLETLLGINLEDGYLRVAPCVPADWKSFKVHYRFHETLYHITINCQAGQPQQVTRLLLDNVELAAASEAGTDNGKFPLINDQQVHHVSIELNS
ncbi:MAG TPA: glucoamylase family protein [Methylophaga sp.]|nr:glucoamylase family protein [Methylophaga sp.]